MSVGLINTTDDEEIKALWRKINAARKWALRHFNAESAESGKLVDEVDGRIVLSRPSFFVEFPRPNTMTVWPAVMGQRTDIAVHYLITFRKDGGVAWYGLHPIRNTVLPPLEISKKEIEELAGNGR